MFVTWLSRWRSCSLCHGSHVFVFVCMCEFLGLQVWKIYCGWELKMSSFGARNLCVSVWVCTAQYMCTYVCVSFWSSLITCRYSCVHACALGYFMYSYMVELQGEWALWVSQLNICLFQHPCSQWRPHCIRYEDPLTIKGCWINFLYNIAPLESSLFSNKGLTMEGFTSAIKGQEQ